mgnify:CR=1 FL=1
MRDIELDQYQFVRRTFGSFLYARKFLLFSFRVIQSIMNIIDSLINQILNLRLITYYNVFTRKFINS